MYYRRALKLQAFLDMAAEKGKRERAFLTILEYLTCERGGGGHHFSYNKQKNKIVAANREPFISSSNQAYQIN